MHTKDLLINTIKNFTADGTFSKVDKCFVKENLKKLDECVTKKERSIIKKVIEPLDKGRLTPADKQIIADSKKIIIKIINNYGEQFNDESNEDDVDEVNDNVDDVEKNLDSKIKKYNGFSANNPMAGVTFDKSKNKFVVNINSTTKRIDEIEDAAQMIIKNFRNKNLKTNSSEFPTNKIQKELLINKNSNLVKYIYNNKSYYDVQHILYYMGLKQSCIRPKYNQIKSNISGYFWKLNEFNGYIMRELINLKTVKILINGARSPRVLILTNLLNIKIIDYKIPQKETINCHKIMKVFTNDAIITQHPIGPYQVDLYFPDYSLVIECDEHNHKDRKQSYEKERQKYIEKKLNVTFIRFNPDDSDFDILDVISRIHYYMKTYELS